MRTLATAVLFAMPLVAQDAAVVAEQQHDDRELVRRAVLDYVEGVYEVGPDRIRRSVDPKLVKRGFGKRDDSPYRDMKMSFEQLVELSGEWNKEDWLPDDAPKEIAVLDVLPRIACAKLTAHWGTDYFQLVKSDEGRWRIRHVLWQSPPPEVKEEQMAETRAGVEAAARGYVDAFYEAEPDLLDGCVHEELAKFGYYGQPGAEKLMPSTMSHTELKSLAERVGGTMAKGAPKEITLLDVQDQTAIVKLVAEWGIDYMHIARFDGNWQIVHVLWQSHPEPTSRSPRRGDEKRRR